MHEKHTIKTACTNGVPDDEHVMFKTWGREQELNLSYAFFWVIPRRLNFICLRFGTLCLFHLHRQVG
jgi:hypothetical protein